MFSLYKQFLPSPEDTPDCSPGKNQTTLAGILLVFITTPMAVMAEESPWQPQPYQLGQGLYFPQQGLRVGGYSSIHYSDLEDQPDTLSVQDLSLFLTKNFGTRWKLFTEMEIGDAVTITADQTTTSEADFDIERLHLDYHAYQGVTLRAGKFLTPVGQWNLIHADPLVWTVSRPLTTAVGFSRHATGAMMYGIVPLATSDLDYWLFVDNSELLDPDERKEAPFSGDETTNSIQNNFERATGARLLYHLFDDQLSIGASYLSFAIQDPQLRYRLSGVDFSWSSSYLDLSGEAISRRPEDSNDADEHGGYLQTVVHLPQRFYLVGRYERYKSALLPETATIKTVGINYRPWQAIAFKLERRTGNNNTEAAPDGWLASFAVLF